MLGFPKPKYKYKRLKVPKVQVQKVPIKSWVLFFEWFIFASQFWVQVLVLRFCKPERFVPKKPQKIVLFSAYYAVCVHSATTKNKIKLKIIRLFYFRYLFELF